MPFDFSELVASFAPRPFFAIAPVGDIDFNVSGVRDAINSARPIYQLFGKPECLQADFPDGPHGFSAASRQRADAFLDRYLKNAER